MWMMTGGLSVRTLRVCRKHAKLPGKMSQTPLYERIYALVRQVPAGYVTTYGQIARLLGCSARTVGFAMAALSAQTDVPWQRVINSQGRVSVRADGERHHLQQLLLEQEGVVFDSSLQVDLDRCRWRFAEPPFENI
jgi:methylated-DNA-protein-cysteine methyltransferase related protein